MKIKKLSSFILCLVMLFELATPALAAQSQTITVDPINVMVGGEIFLPTDANGKNVPVFVYNGTTYAPLRALAEAYGLTVGYNAEKKLATVDGTPAAGFAKTRGTAQALTQRTSISVSPINIEVNGAVFQPKDANGNAVSVFVYSGTTYAPLRALAEAYGLTAGYNAEKKLATADFVEVNGIEFAELLEDVNAAREAEIKSPVAFAGYTDYLVNDPATKNLLTAAEINALLNTEGKDVQTVTVEQAVSDIDLLFRALHVGYGAYYYFGQDAYDRAEAEVMAWLDGQTTVSVDQLTDVLRQSLSFMVDAHSSVAGSIDQLEGIRYEYHYCTQQQYDKDAQGYFKRVNGQRVDVVGFSDALVTMDPTLLPSGKLVYSPVLFCPDNQVTAATIQLKRADGTTYTESLSWSATKEFSSTHESKYEYIEENGLAYFSVASFHDTGEFAAYYEGFSRAGSQVKDCKAIIFDLRSNGGGNGASMYQWIRNFTGIEPELREAYANRYSPLNSSNTQSTYAYSHTPAGKWLPNDIPVIVLMNDACGSAGELALNLLKSMDNVLVVGTNSAGYQLGGNAVDICLPNTNIRASIGTQLRFMFEVKNVDCIGYTPDVWCDPDEVVDAVLNLLVLNGMADETADRSFMEAVDACSNNDVITLGFDKYTVQGGSGFGSSHGTHTIRVYLNGESASDFSVTSADTSACVVKKTSGGTFEVTSVGPGRTAITVQCGNKTETFYWAS